MRIGLAQLICLLLGVFFLSFGSGLYGGRLAAKKQERTARESPGSGVAHSPKPAPIPSVSGPAGQPDQTGTAPDLILSPPPAIPTKSQQPLPIVENDDSSSSPDLKPTKTAGTRFMIQAISTSNQADASNSRRRLMAEGFSAGIFEADLGERGKWYRVYVGPYSSEAEARLGLEAVQRIPGFKESFVKSLD